MTDTTTPPSSLSQREKNRTTTTHHVTCALMIKINCEWALVKGTYVCCRGVLSI